MQEGKAFLLKKMKTNDDRRRKEMSQFGYSDYKTLVERAQSGSSSTRIGFFKLADDGDEALVRINCGSLDDLKFATVHSVNAGGRWIRVSCHNPAGSYSSDGCELCKVNNEAEAEAKMQGIQAQSSVGRASKKVYVQMLVSYKDKATGQWGAPQPVVWERPAGFSRDLANFLANYGDLRKQLVKITRNGKARDMKTTYSMLPAAPAIFKQEMIPEDFSAFNGFNIAKHSYWEKTDEEIHEFVTTGAFPEPAKANANAFNGGYQAPAAQIAAAQTAVAEEAPAYHTQEAASVYGTTVIEPAPAPAKAPDPELAPANNVQETAPATEPERKFNTSRFSF